jgi:hypothetical protein
MPAPTTVQRLAAREEPDTSPVSSMIAESLSVQFHPLRKS